MQKMDWDPSFSVGVRLLDHQHKQILAMINLLVSRFLGGDARSETTSELLSKLTQYAREHFRTEERLLAEHGYPGLASQKDEHKAYRLRVVALCQDAMAHKASTSLELLGFMGEWWVHHIRETDMQYRSFLVERDVK